MTPPADAAAQFTEIWGNSARLTPRQARAIAVTLDVWGDEIQSDWLTTGSREPLHNVPPFNLLDLRVMMLVADSTAWAAAAVERCHAVAEEIAAGTLPFDRDGCFFDELLIALALREAPGLLEQLPDLFVGIPEREAPPAPEDGDGDGESAPLGDDEWDLVSDGFDDICRHDEWEVPAMVGHILLPTVVAEHHPYRWFDPGKGSGAGYLQRLAAQRAAAAE